jgi:transcription initiation factor TFIIIB Brf1 subunit/transcription initiation factor TFIIB
MRRTKIVCPNCGCTKVMQDHARGELVCAGCGLVLEDRVLSFDPPSDFDQYTIEGEAHGRRTKKRY